MDTSDEGADFLRLEQKYPYLLRTDISKCFYHIYTHSIAWAIKSKEFAKEHTTKTTFENKLDTLMQHGNYNETNGIIVGPEVSRIFAEIILQRVDLNLIEELKKQKMHVGTDYEIRRYVDDYFIFAQTKEKLDIILQQLTSCLIPYKLDVNKSKTETLARPFATARSDAKLELSRLVDELDSYIHIENGEDKTKVLNSHDKLFKHIIGSFRKITHHHGVSYSDLSSFMLTLLRKKIVALEEQKEKVANTEILFALCSISFYIYSLDMYATVSHKICDIIYLLNKCALNMKSAPMARMELITMIDREVQRCLQYGTQMRKKDEINIETMNLLLALDRISLHPISMDKIAYVIGKTSVGDVKAEDFKGLNYFQICVLLYLMNNRAEMEEWKEWLLEAIPSIYMVDTWERRADLTCLFLDLAVCPYIKNGERNKVLAKALGRNENKMGADLKQLRISGCERWFFDWNRNRDFGQVLEKKRYHFAYG